MSNGRNGCTVPVLAGDTGGCDAETSFFEPFGSLGVCCKTASWLGGKPVPADALGEVGSGVIHSTLDANTFVNVVGSDETVPPTTTMASGTRHWYSTAHEMLPIIQRCQRRIKVDKFIQAVLIV